MLKKTRYLGLDFDSRLTRVAHLHAVKTACRKALSLLWILAHTSWGADRDTLLLFHRTLILPKLEYDCKIYPSATEARLRIFDSVHHAGVRLATGAFRSSPIPSLLVDAGLLICIVIRLCCVVGSRYNAFPSLSPVSQLYRILIRSLILLALVSPNLLGFGLSLLWRHCLLLLFLSSLKVCTELGTASSSVCPLINRL